MHGFRLCILVSFLAVGCAGPRFVNAEVRAYEAMPELTSLAADYEIREDHRALRVDVAKAVNLFQNLEADPLAVGASVAVPAALERRALILSPEEDQGEYWLMAFDTDARTGEPILLSWKQRVKWTVVEGLKDDFGNPMTARVAANDPLQPPSFLRTSWTTERAKLWAELLQGAARPQPTFD